MHEMGRLLRGDRDVIRGFVGSEGICGETIKRPFKIAGIKRIANSERLHLLQLNIQKYTKRIKTYYITQLLVIHTAKTN